MSAFESFWDSAQSSRHFLKEKYMKTSLLSINCIRALCIDTINKAKSGHPGMALGSAQIGRASCRERV